MCEYDHNIVLNNIENDLTLCYSIVLLKGEVVARVHDEININFNTECDNFTTSSSSTLIENKFKHLIELKPGQNKITVTYCCSSIILTLFYKQKNTEYCVVPLYIITKNHDGKFQSPSNENTPEIACDKITIGTKLIQCLLAEKFAENGFSRKTFQLESEINASAPNCRIFYSDLDTEAVRKMRQDEIWFAIGRELMSSKLANEKYKYLAFISCTRYKGDDYQDGTIIHEQILNLTEGHAALGGGGLAIFGTACLHTWPKSLAEVANSFQDQTKVNKKQFMDDSCYRGTYGGCFATTLGSVCHELCHTFDLGHTEEGIMGRGFDEINKDFVVNLTKFKVQKVLSPEEQHCTVAFTPNINVKITQKNPALQEKINTFKKLYPLKTFPINKSGIYWTQNCLVLLHFHRWFNEENKAQQELKFEENLITSSAGLSMIEIRDEVTGLILEWWNFCDKKVNQFHLAQSELEKYIGVSLTIIIQDIVGNIVKENLII